MKYTYPNYNALKDFRSDYFLLDQINYYLFSNFKEPYKYSYSFFQNSLNCFHLIILLIEYSLIFCLFINILNYYKIISQITDPFKKLKKAIESNSTKNENIFNYKYDDIINEFFITCK